MSFIQLNLRLTSCSTLRYKILTNDQESTLFQIINHVSLIKRAQALHSRDRSLPWQPVTQQQTRTMRPCLGPDPKWDRGQQTRAFQWTATALKWPWSQSAG